MITISRAPGPPMLFPIRGFHGTTFATALRCWASPPPSPPADARSPTYCVTAADLSEGGPSCYHRVLSLARVVRLALGRPLDPLPAAPLLAPGARHPPRRRWPPSAEHPGPQGVRPGTPRRPSAPVAATPPGSRGAQVGGAGHPCVVPLLLPTLGVAGPGRPAITRPRDDRQRGEAAAPRPDCCDCCCWSCCVSAPTGKFVVAGDASYGSHEVASLAGRYPGAAVRREQMPRRRQPVCAPPACRRVRPAARQGRELPTPQEGESASRAAASETWPWCGGGRRSVDIVSGTEHWYRGRGLVAVR